VRPKDKKGEWQEVKHYQIGSSDYVIPVVEFAEFEISSSNALTREEFLDVFFDELALPNLVKRHLAYLKDYRRKRAGFTQSGVPTNLNLPRTMRGAAGRRMAIGGAHHTRIRELEAELELLLPRLGEEDPEVRRLRREIALHRARLCAMPFIDSFDMRYNYRDRMYMNTVDGVTGTVLSGRAPGDPLFQSLAVTAGTSVGGLLGATGVIVASASAEAAVACFVVGVLVLVGTYLFFRGGSEITEGEFSDRGFKLGDLKDMASQLSQGRLGGNNRGDI